MRNPIQASREFYLPDFCQSQSVFVVVLVAELFAIVCSLLESTAHSSIWGQLGLYSLAIQIITLVSVSCLCLLRPWLARYRDLVSGALSLLVILISTFLFSWAINQWYSVDLYDQVDQQRHLIIRNLLLAGLIGSATLRYFYLQQQYRNQVALESAARLEALQAKIRPHFLFNSMNVIASLTRIDPIKAESAIEDLCDLFRATLDNQNELIPFADELEHGEKYLAIEQLRLGDRLSVEKVIEPATLAVPVPPLSIQPLLENAVYHGIQMLADGGCVSINALIDNRYFKLTITNPISNGQSKQGNGIALSNIRQRLLVLYQNKAKLVQKSESNQYCVELWIPLQK